MEQVLNKILNELKIQNRLKALEIKVNNRDSINIRHELDEIVNDLVYEGD